MQHHNNNLNKAIRLVQSGKTQTEVARKTGVPRSTLSHNLRSQRQRQRQRQPKRKTKPQPSVKQQQLSPEQEQMLEDWLLMEELAGRIPSKRYVIGFAKEMLKSNGDGRPRLGVAWLDDYLERHPHLRSKVAKVDKHDRKPAELFAHEGPVMVTY